MRASKCDTCMFFSKHRTKQSINLRPIRWENCLFPNAPRKELKPYGDCGYYLPNNLLDKR